MKRDMNLIRQLLLTIEDSDGEIGTDDLEFEGWTPNEIDYNARLLYEGVLIDGIDSGHMQRQFIISNVRITMEGHDFLDSIRDDGVWSQVTERLKKTGGTAAIEVVKQLAIKVASDILLK